MIKRDINLLPARKKLPASVTYGIPIAVVLLAILLLAGIYFPSASLNRKQADLDKLNTELLSYGDVNLIYPQKLQELNTLQEVKKNYENFFSDSKYTLKMMNMLNEITPEEISILQYDFRETDIVISGFAESDLNIADYEDTLWKTNLFSEITLGTISGEDGARSFNFTMLHKVEQEQEEGGNS